MWVGGGGAGEKRFNFFLMNVFFALKGSKLFIII